MKYVSGYVVGLQAYSALSEGNTSSSLCPVVCPNLADDEAADRRNALITLQSNPATAGTSYGRPVLLSVYQ